MTLLHYVSIHKKLTMDIHWAINSSRFSVHGLLQSTEQWKRVVLCSLMTKKSSKAGSMVMPYGGGSAAPTFTYSTSCTDTERPTYSWFPYHPTSLTFDAVCTTHCVHDLPALLGVVISCSTWLPCLRTLKKLHLLLHAVCTEISE